MRVHVQPWVAAALFTAGVHGILPAATPAAQPYAGHWQVRQVLLDETRTDRFLYQVNDPRLVGRMVVIDERQIESDLPEASACAQPVLTPEPHVLNTLLQQTMLPAVSGQDAAHAFGLNVPGTQEVKVAWIACTTGQFGPSLKGGAAAAARQGKPGRSWLALAAPHQLLVRWYGDTVLLLEPTSPDQPASPSFSCGQARWPAERAICASPRLASYDISLAKAWGAAVQACEGDAACLNQARRAQKQWVSQRNRCEQDEACLRKAMTSRLNALMAPAED